MESHWLPNLILHIKPRLEPIFNLIESGKNMIHLLIISVIVLKEKMQLNDGINLLVTDISERELALTAVPFFLYSPTYNTQDNQLLILHV